MDRKKDDEKEENSSNDKKLSLVKTNKIEVRSVLRLVVNY